MEAVVCVMIVKEKETIVKNMIAQIKLEFTFADFFQEFVGLNKPKNEVSGDQGDQGSGRLLKEPLFKLLN